MIKIDDCLCDNVATAAKDSYRKRMNHNFHDSFDNPLQRFLNAVEPESYIQPHKHSEPMKEELFLLIKGSVLVLEYNDEGDVIEHTVLSHKYGNYGVEIKANAWHSCVALEQGTLFYEVKAGPYCPPDKVMADWAPEEGSDDAVAFMENLIRRYAC